MATLPPQIPSPDAAGGALAPGSLVIDVSTMAPATREALTAQLAKQGVAYLDAPVTGGTEGARQSDEDVSALARWFAPQPEL